LKRFLAPQLAELIVSQGDEKILESHRREIVVVFCDLRGYTAFTETAEPEEVGSEDAMWFFALLLAQIPLPTTCDGVVTELKMNPPAYGDQGRAAYAWDKFLRECEARLGGPGKTFSAEEVNEIAKVINPPPR
jgi:hypothetical protein